MKKILLKIRSQSGESIGETLVALLISSLALVMLAGAVSSASNIITRSNQVMSDYYETLGSAEESMWHSAIQNVIAPTSISGGDPDGG